MKTHRARRIALLSLLALPVVSVRSATVTWTGSGDTTWSNAANWGGTPLDANPTSNTVTFNTAGVPNQATNNDLSNLILSSLTFGTTLNQATSLGGNAFTLAGGLTASTTAQPVSIGNNVTLGADSTWNIARHVTLTGTLGDDGTARILTKSGAGLLALGGGAYVGNSGGNILVTGGALGISNANQLSDAWLSLNGGVVVLDGVSWSQFSADRSAGYRASSGTANTWGINNANGGFAARGTDVNIFINASTAASYGTITAGEVFNRDFRLGTSAVDANGVLYANAAVEISQNTVLTTGRTVNLSGGATQTGGAYTLSGPIHEFSGVISSSVPATARTLTLQGSGVSSGNSSGIPIFRMSNSANTDLNVATSSSGTGAGWGVLILSDDLVVPGTITINSSSPGQGGPSGWLLLFEGNNTFDKNLTYSSAGSATAVTHGLGAFSGNVVYRGTLTNSGTGANTANLQWHAQSGATFTLGATGNAADFVTTRTGQGGTVVNVYRKTGAGTAILENVAHTGSYQYEVQNGALRETGSGATDSAQGVHLVLSGGVLESNNTNLGGVGFIRSLGTGAANVRWTAGGGFSARDGALTVNIGNASGAQTWNTSNFVTSNNALVFGSETANDVVTFVNPIILGTTGTNTREIRVVDNLDALVTTDRAVLSGNLTQSGGTQSLLKSGTGLLELTGANNYIGTTTVSGGTLRLNGATHTAGNNYTVSSGATLELLGAGLDFRAPQLVMNAGASLLQTAGAWDVNDLFHIAGSGGSLQVADLADTNDGSAVLRYTVDASGAGMLELTDDNPFMQYGGSASAWAAEWTIDLVTTPGLQQIDFVPTISLMGSTEYDLTGLDGLVRLTAWDSGSTPFTYTNLADGQKVYLSSGVALAEYTVSFTENGFDLVFEGSRAIPEPGTLSLIGLALLFLRRQLRKRAAA